MVWRVRADCTYTTTSNKTARQTAAQDALDAHSGWVPVAGRFAPGLTSMSSTRFTVSVDCPDVTVASTLMASLRSALTASARSQTYFSYHDAGDE